MFRSYNHQNFSLPLFQLSYKGGVYILHFIYLGGTIVNSNLFFNKKMNTEKVLLSIPLIYATYLVISCPCDTIMKCHQKEYLFAVGIPTIYIFGKIIF